MLGKERPYNEVVGRRERVQWADCKTGFRFRIVGDQCNGGPWIAVNPNREMLLPTTIIT